MGSLLSWLHPQQAEAVPVTANKVPAPSTAAPIFAPLTPLCQAAAAAAGVAGPVLTLGSSTSCRTDCLASASLCKVSRAHFGGMHVTYAYVTEYGLL